eukprot:1082342-Pyramimonas_sp.AAC.1
MSRYTHTSDSLERQRGQVAMATVALSMGVLGCSVRAMAQRCSGMSKRPPQGLRAFQLKNDSLQSGIPRRTAALHCRRRHQ